MDKNLYYFQVVAKCQNITLACDELHISQPALTRSIKKIEEQLGVELFKRLPRGVELTKSGSVFLSRVNRMDMEYQFALKEINAMKSGQNIRLRIGSDNLWAELYISSLLDQFYDLNPEAEVRVKAGTVASNVPELLKGGLDLVLGKVGYEGEIFQALTCKPLIPVEFVVVARPEHKLHQQDSVTLSMLQGYRWIIYQHSDNYVWHINETFYKHGLGPAKVSLHTAFLENALSQMQKDDFLMYIPHQLLKPMSDKGLKVIPMDKPIHSFQSGVYYSEFAAQMPGVRQFLKLLNAQFKF
ncbi:LysR family transcriptional regulator [Endozoicomonas sp. SCSIO W0465]|uniref:LysR family transcriptional regulator n=1 Tax=Endozoicomonas sp. SCSIO W0465 TaxID=2918516 RepID=UPI00207507B9|nr:LysR family transcriptional regulator [Endozoicomonas sp. SCSIO W0465]USE38841.1 LysR family transcriptional regulator [Endozoicomonas sp. SCSIO W0465]